MVNATPRPLYLREREPIPTVQEAGEVPGPMWTNAEKLAPTGFRSRDRPAPSDLLRHPGPMDKVQAILFVSFSPLPANNYMSEYPRG